MAKVAKVEGFNPKEQKILNALSDGAQHDIRELKKLFWDAAKEHCGEIYEKGWGEGEVNSQAQSYVRNSIRRLIRDGWVEGPHMNDNLPRGTYKLTQKGKNWIAKGVSVTPSLKEREERREERKVKTAAKKEKAKKAPKTKKTVKAKTEKKEAKAPKEKKAPKPKKAPKAAKKAKAKPVSKAASKKAKPANGAQAKAQAAKAKVSKESAKEKAQEAARRAAKESTPTGNMTSSEPAPTPAAN